MNRNEILRAGLNALGLDLPETATQRLLAYVDLLVKWNRTYNLTAIRDGDEMVTQHLLDSLSILPFLQDVQSLADIGSGAGLPGIPLAIAQPQLAVTLIDSVQKKSAFQQQAKIDLALTNVSIYSGRIEDYRKYDEFDAVTARAFSDLPLLAKAAGPLLRPGGRIYAMKGVLPQDEMAALPAPWHVAATPRLLVPGLSAERHLLILERN
ncbi:methyltransferase, SAM-dependent methyltransferase, glucose-inhibited cell-division protein [Georgfuchsia toluolica]|uniref:Ribosomal RNA small subunit methyltransferase G n=1 Tax=Georgfuchsia toluolica TaxID=424218 RepID=A0A916J5A7_9PROT|nr:16S rRNA (guanine(527)-N(7))-methyltransferase RsmG [Georgfuchsia toluolica]CAG4884474.1 methyltransferase, SAM-dependent methyltransferase, glucose-inhibited cell-division protein [Georgfuchsia toluolica]